MMIKNDDAFTFRDLGMECGCAVPASAGGYRAEPIWTVRKAKMLSSVPPKISFHTYLQKCYKYHSSKKVLDFLA